MDLGAFRSSVVILVVPGPDTGRLYIIDCINGIPNGSFLEALVINGAPFRHVPKRIISYWMNHSFEGRWWMKWNEWKIDVMNAMVVANLYCLLIDSKCLCTVIVRVVQDLILIVDLLIDILHRIVLCTNTCYHKICLYIVELLCSLVLLMALQARLPMPVKQHPQRQWRRSFQFLQED